jgi:Tol biopolymer transport system component
MHGKEAIYSKFSSLGVRRPALAVLALALALIVAACNQETNGSREIRVELVADQRQRTFVYDQPVTVGQFLEQVGVTLNPDDTVEPPLFTQITDGMTITVVRVTETRECRQEVLPFDERQLPRTDLEPGTRVIAEPGVNGIVEICERVIRNDGVERSRSQISTIVIQEPKTQTVFVGRSDELDPVAIEGTLAYISGGQAWLVRSNSALRRPLTTEGGLDGRVFDLSSNGRLLLYTRRTPDPDDLAFSNELWVILDTANSSPIQLVPTDVLTAAWQPGRPLTIAYSTASASATAGFQGWIAYNDLWIMRINEQDADVLSVAPALEENLSGEFASWGTRFAWSPDGTKLAYAKATGVGLVDLAGGDFLPFAISFPYYNSAIANRWVWQPTLSWSQDGKWVITTVHGPPFGEENPVDSIIFDVGVFQADGALVIEKLIERSGIWASPVYSPETTDAAGFPAYSIAYLQARDPSNSYGTDYDLVVVDRDGSNPRRIFPPEGQPGIRPIALEDETPFAWSPSGRQIAVIYQNNLWLVEVATGLTQQITNDGQTSAPRWTQ